MSYTSEYPSNAVCADVCVVKHGHVLVVTRADNGKFALPGGHVDLSESCQEAAIRELHEETGLKIDRFRKPDGMAVFDDPRRAEGRGRIISHAFYYRLDMWGGLPNVKGNDDASGAHWMNFADFLNNKTNFHDDHYFIILKFIEGLL